MVEAPGPRWKVLRRAGRFAVLTVQKAWRDDLPLQADALAFTTVFALVPLLATFLYVGERVFVEYRQQVVNILQQFLPYSETILLNHVERFLDQARTIRGPALAGFLVVAFFASARVENALNLIWEVQRARTFRARLISRLVLFLWGPLLIGAAYSGLLLLRQRAAFERLFQESVFLQSIPFLATLIGLTMLYWRVPNARVRFTAALAGGAVATLLLEILRRSFRLYLEAVPAMSLVYGGFALALLFMASIDLGWLTVLVGGEVAYTAQHFSSMLRRGRREHRERDWLAVAALAIVAERLRCGHRDTPLAALADGLDLPLSETRAALEPLLASGFLQETRGGYHLGSSPDRIRVREVLELYRGVDRKPGAPYPGPLHSRLTGLRGRVRERESHEVGDLTLQQLVEEGEVAAICELPEPAGKRAGG